MEALNFAIVAERLLNDDKQLKLVNYIFDTQGAQLARLDYREAAKALGIDKHTVSRYVTELTDKKIIYLSGTELKLNPDIIEDVS